MVWLSSEGLRYRCDRTDGKQLLLLFYHILKTAGLKVSMISSVSAVIDNKQYSLPFHVTTLPPFALQRFISMAASGSKTKIGKKYLVLEVTSHALDQFRVFGTDFDIGVITNVSNEHLDYHKTYKEYVKTKLKLLQGSKIVVVNKEDRSYKIIQPELKKIVNKISRVVAYGLNSSSDVNLSNSPFQTKLWESLISTIFCGVCRGGPSWDQRFDDKERDSEL